MLFKSICESDPERCSVKISPTKNIKMWLEKFPERLGGPEQALVMDGDVNKPPPNMNYDENVDVIQSNKGHFKIIHQGYMYTKHKSFNNVTRWRCAARGTCRGSIMTGNDFSRPIPKMTHSHPADFKACELAKSRYLIPKINKELIFKTELFKPDNAPGPQSMDSIESRSAGQANFSYEYCPLSEDPLEGKPHFMDMLGLVPPGGSPMGQSPETPPMQQIKKDAAAPQQHMRKSASPMPPQKMTVHTGKEPLKQYPSKAAAKPQPPAEVCLRWNSYHSNMQNTFPNLLNNEQFVDVTLACDGRSIKCHKVMLSACSPYMEELLSSNPCQHPIIFLKDMKFWQLAALVDFMYRGEVNVTQDKLPSLLSAAEALQIKGLASPVTPSTPPPSQAHATDSTDSGGYLRQFQPDMTTDGEEESYVQDTEDEDETPSAPVSKKRKMSDVGAPSSGRFNSSNASVNGKKTSRDKDSRASTPNLQPMSQVKPSLLKTCRSVTEREKEMEYKPKSGYHDRQHNASPRENLNIDEEHAQSILLQYSQTNEGYTTEGGVKFEGDDGSNDSG